MNAGAIAKPANSRYPMRKIFADNQSFPAE
jgi:hypothetical protein